VARHPSNDHRGRRQAASRIAGSHHFRRARAHRHGEYLPQGVVIVPLIKAVQYLLELKAVRARWDLEREIELYVDHFEKLIAEKRNAGDHAGADLLRHKLLRSSAIAIPRQPDSAVEVGGTVRGTGG